VHLKDGIESGFFVLFFFCIIFAVLVWFIFVFESGLRKLRSHLGKQVSTSYL
jgi:hypothetical protein